jgi:hypothetical protein
MDTMAVDLSTTARSELAKVLHSKEKVLWSARPIARHAWTITTVSQIKTRTGRAVAVAIIEVLSAYALFIGLIFLAACVETLWTFSSWWSVTITLVVFLPISVVIFGSGLWGMDYPFRAIRLVGRSSYVLTDRSAFIVTDHEPEIVIQRFGLHYMQPPEVFRVMDSGVGDVVLDSRVVTLIGGDSSPSNASFDCGFFAVPDAETVVELVEEARVAWAEVAESEIIEEMQENYQDYLRRTGQL